MGDVVLCLTTSSDMLQGLLPALPVSGFTFNLTA